MCFDEAKKGNKWGLYMSNFANFKACAAIELNRGNKHFCKLSKHNQSSDLHYIIIKERCSKLDNAIHSAIDDARRRDVT